MRKIQTFAALFTVMVAGLTASTSRCGRSRPLGGYRCFGYAVGTFEWPTQQQLVFAAEPIPTGHGDDQNHEIRMNKPTFDYIVANGLYSIGGKQAMFYSGNQIVFPQDSIEIKAVWRPISEADKPRDKWNIFTHADGTETHYGLTGFHIMTGVIDNWFFATFEHEDNPYRRGMFDKCWMLPSVNSAACPDRPVGCMASPTGIGLQDTVWEHYRLRDRQIDYVDENGTPSCSRTPRSRPACGWKSTTTMKMST